MGADASYYDAWQDLADRATAMRPDADFAFEFDADSFPHSTDGLANRPARYESVTVDTPSLPAHVLDCGIQLGKQEHARLRAAALERSRRSMNGGDTDVPADIDIIPKTARIRLYYGGVMIVWFDLGLGLRLDGSPAVDETLSTIEQLGIALTQELAVRISEELAGLFDMARPRGASPLQRASRFFGGEALPWSVIPPLDRSADAEVEPTHVAGDIGDLPSLRGPAYWVTRSLVLTNTDERVPGLLTWWLDPVSQSDWRGEMAENGFSMQWLRYAFDEGALTERQATDAWESMLFCQFFWAALERVERWMFHLIGKITPPAKRSEIRHSFARLNQAREEAELTLAHHRQLKRHLTRTRNRLVNQILESGGFSRFIDNLHDVIAIARSRHEQLLQRATARSNVFTDVLLFVIGSVAFLDFFVSLTIIGRQLSSDPAIGRHDEGWLDVLGYLSGQRIDLVLSFASLPIIVMVAILWFRNRQIY